jgi:hypothetical protein
MAGGMIWLHVTAHPAGRVSKSRLLRPVNPDAFA